MEAGQTRAGWDNAYLGHSLTIWMRSPCGIGYGAPADRRRATIVDVAARKATSGAGLIAVGTYRRNHMLRCFALTLVALLALTSRSAHADLAAYLRAPDPAYRWEKVSETPVEGAIAVELKLTSQTWQGAPWTHKLVIVRPLKLDHPHFCTLLNTGGHGSDSENQVASVAAQATGASFAILYDIPNQPLFDGLTEDALVAHTFQKYLETSDDTWPLQLPMTKAILKAMDAIQEWTRKDKRAPITDFLITGASKRGWSTWLAGASRDKRIKGIAPMVIDTLNIPAQIPHQIEAYGKPSDQIHNYTDLGLTDKFGTERGKQLIQLVDPYSYRAILTLPKLIVLGSNDPYWSQDSLNLYWDALKGPKYVMYAPNSGHGLEDRLRVFSVLAAFARSLAEGTPLPQPTWKFATTDSGLDLHMSVNAPVKDARLWQAMSDTKDFRKAQWHVAPMTDEGGWRGHIDYPRKGFIATFGELVLNDGHANYSLSSQVRIFSAADHVDARPNPAGAARLAALRDRLTFARDCNAPADAAGASEKPGDDGKEAGR